MPSHRTRRSTTRSSFHRCRTRWPPGRPDGRQLTDDLDPACEPETRRICKHGAHANRDRQADRERGDGPDGARGRRESVWSTTMRFRRRCAISPGRLPTRYVPARACSTVAFGRTATGSTSIGSRNDCLFERRLVVNRTDVGDPAPSPFLCSSDDTGRAHLRETWRAPCSNTRLGRSVRTTHVASRSYFARRPAWEARRADCAVAVRACRMLCWPVARGFAETMVKATLVLRPGIPGEVPATQRRLIRPRRPKAGEPERHQPWRSSAIGRADDPEHVERPEVARPRWARSVFEQELARDAARFPLGLRDGPTSRRRLVAGTATVPVNTELAI